MAAREAPSSAASMDAEESADSYDRAVNIVLRDRKCSTSYIQRRLSVGYNKAASLVERMEKEGVVGAANHAGKREIRAIATLHPAYLLRQPLAKRLAWRDFLAVKAALAERAR